MPERRTGEEIRARLTEAAAAVLAGAQDHELKIVVLNKALFYLDLLALRDLGHVVTGAPFVASPMGPTVKDYQDRVVGELERRGVATQKKAGSAKPVKLVSEPQYRTLSDAERRIARHVGASLSGATSVLASDMSHENLGWKIARGDDARERSINMVVAMQQVIDRDPWLDQEPTPAETAAFDATSEHDDVAW